MANFHIRLYRWLLDDWAYDVQKAKLLQSFLTLSSFIELKKYPSNAKYYLTEFEHILNGYTTRKDISTIMTATDILELRQLKALSDQYMLWLRQE